MSAPAAPVDPPSLPSLPLLPIVYEDRRVVVIDKPAGWLSVPSRIGAADERPCAGRRLEAQLGVRLWPVHRLDLEVSGLLVFAKDAEAHRLLSQAFEGRTVHKTYAGRSEGQPPADAPLLREVLWESTLLRGKKRAYLHPAGKPAQTLATLLAVEEPGAGRPGGRVLRWRLRPLTGRAHQLRIELGRRGCPLCGDTLYGASTTLPDGGIALRAVALALGPAAAQLGLPPELHIPEE
jgi:tRNA pseudouridine32 synthase/23S rRNA pseudouridine746 synthase